MALDPNSASTLDLTTIPNNGGGGSGTSDGSGGTSGNGDTSATVANEDALKNATANFSGQGNFTGNTDQSGSDSGDAPKAAEGLSRSLSEEQLQGQDRAKEHNPLAEAHHAALLAKGRLGLSEEQFQHLEHSLAGKAMSGVELSAGVVDQNVQRVAGISPDVLAQAREAMQGFNQQHGHTVTDGVYASLGEHARQNGPDQQRQQQVMNAPF